MRRFLVIFFVGEKSLTAGLHPDQFPKEVCSLPPLENDPASLPVLHTLLPDRDVYYNRKLF